MPAGNRQSFAHNAVSIFLGQVGTWLLTAVTLGLLARYLGSASMGVFTIGGTFAALASTIAGLGMGTLLTRDVARDRERAAEILGTAIWLNVALGIAACSVAVALGFALGYSRLVLFAIVVSCAGIPFGLVSGTCSALVQGLEVMRWSAIFDVAGKMLWLVVAGLVVGFDLGVRWLLVASLLTGMSFVLPQLLLAKRLLPFSLRTFSRTHTGYLVRGSLPFLLTGVFFLLYNSTDIVLLSRLADESAVGVYGAPMRLLGTMLFVPVTITTVVFPRLARSGVSPDGELGSIGRATMRVSVAIGVAITLAGIALGDPHVVGLLGHSFDRSAPVIVVVSLSVVPTTVGIVASRMLFATDRQRIVSVLGVAAFAGKLASGVVLIPLFDQEFGNAALGAAAGFVAVEIGMATGMLRALPPGVLGPAEWRFYGRLALGAVCGALAVVVVFAASPVLAAGTGVGAYGVALVAVGIVRPRAAVSLLRRLALHSQLEAAAP